MGLNWNQISMDEMTMLYLYGSFTYPSSLKNDALIRPEGIGATITLDTVSYMATGPGRFAAGSLSPLIEEFMGDHGIATNQELLEGVPHEINAQGQRIFTKQDIAGYLVSKGYISGSFGINIQQYNYRDEVASDIAIRTYIYGSTARVGRNNHRALRRMPSHLHTHPFLFWRNALCLLRPTSRAFGLAKGIRHGLSSGLASGRHLLLHGQPAATARE